MSKMSNLGFATKFPKFTEITPEPKEVEVQPEAKTPKMRTKSRKVLKPKRRALNSGHIRTRVGGYPFVINDLEKFEDLIKPVGEWRAHSVEELPIPELKPGNKVLCKDGIGVYCKEKPEHDSPCYYIKVLNEAWWTNYQYHGVQQCNICVRESPIKQRAWMPIPKPYKIGINEEGWFTCDKYLPPHKTRVLVTTERGKVNITYYHKYAEEFANNTIGEIVAWRPLPGDVEVIPSLWKEPPGWRWELSELSGIKGDILLLMCYFSSVEIYRIVSDDSLFVWPKDIDGHSGIADIMAWCITPDEYKNIPVSAVDESDIMEFWTGDLPRSNHEVKFTAVRVREIEKLLGLETKE